jgi:hypothetical protein
MKKEEMESIGKLLEKLNKSEFKIDDSLSIKKSAAGSYEVFSGGGHIDAGELSAEQESKIREKFNLESGNRFDQNPLIPNMAPSDVKEKDDDFDKNELIP